MVSFLRRAGWGQERQGEFMCFYRLVQPCTFVLWCVERGYFPFSLQNSLYKIGGNGPVYVYQMFFFVVVAD
ncbi:Putative protein [Zobellia galactanivorans]|uniref:Uncharacterized protein n=1 Tax=Zobellia galactanivorans (strain DSM 12802 / CCUG 47099 / CIP 106680 / NCIMB 13871 / Dsij) TaxID=63186 RepID=G0LCQ6_ZOBGA|nr:hypothetical protein B4Q04_12170 [Zobellia sp. OII3]CAZ97104.1 Putative protein [Zobellia galactanivorans]